MFPRSPIHSIVGEKLSEFSMSRMQQQDKRKALWSAAQVLARTARKASLSKSKRGAELFDGGFDMVLIKTNADE